jgi:predicted RND superfamily exporter protein
MIFLLPIIASVIAVTFLLGIVRPGQVPTTSLTRPERLPVSCLMLVIALGFTFINRRIVDCALGVTDGLGKLFLPVFLAAVLGISGWLSIIGGRK